MLALVAFAESLAFVGTFVAAAVVMFCGGVLIGPGTQPLWPMLAWAETLVQRRGAASVPIARFTGAVRAFVPLLAGLARMPRVRFYGVNVLSALLWAPVHILPGALLGSSLQIAEAVSGWLAMLLVLLVALLWFAAWR